MPDITAESSEQEIVQRVQAAQDVCEISERMLSNDPKKASGVIVEMMQLRREVKRQAARIAELEQQVAAKGKSLRDAEDQLCAISRTFGGKDARHVEGDGEHTIAAMVAEQVAALRLGVKALADEARTTNDQG
jgi:replicative DNA helicase